MPLFIYLKSVGLVTVFVVLVVVDELGSSNKSKKLASAEQTKKQQITVCMMMMMVRIMVTILFTVKLFAKRISMVDYSVVLI